MKKIIAGTALAVGYIILCRLTRGYWALSGDMIVIILAAAAYIALDMGLNNDKADDKRSTCVKVAESTGSVEKHVG